MFKILRATTAISKKIKTNSKQVPIAPAIMYRNILLLDPISSNMFDELNDILEERRIEEMEPSIELTVSETSVEILSSVLTRIVKVELLSLKLAVSIGVAKVKILSLELVISIVVVKVELLSLELAVSI